MMLHQDGSRHEWVEGKQWDLIVTMDDATNEHYSMFFVEEEGTMSSFNGVKETIEKRGYSVRSIPIGGSHSFYTHETGGKACLWQTGAGVSLCGWVIGRIPRAKETCRL